MPLHSLLLALAVEAQAGCVDDLSASLDKAEESFANTDAQGARAAVAAVDAAVGCLIAPIDARTAARVHRAHALAAHLSGASPLDHLQAMRRADPWLRWDVADAVHPLTLQLHAIEEKAVPPVRLLPSTSDWRVDGLAVPVVAQGLPAIVQAMEQGRVGENWVAADDKAVRVRPSSGGRAPWTLAGVASAALAAGLYGGAWAANHSYHGAVEAGDDLRIRRMHGITNSLSISSVGAAGAAATLLVVGFSR